MKIRKKNSVEESEHVLNTIHSWTYGITKKINELKNEIQEWAPTECVCVQA